MAKEKMIPACQIEFRLIHFIWLWMSPKCPSLRRQTDLRTLLQSTMPSFIS
jgi:hypothetical protein